MSESLLNFHRYDDRKMQLYRLKEELCNLKNKIESFHLYRNFESDLSDRIIYIANLYYIYLKVCKFLDDFNNFKLEEVRSNIITTLADTLLLVGFNVSSIKSLIKNEEETKNFKGNKIRFTTYIKKYEKHMKLLMEYKELRVDSASIYYFLGIQKQDKYL